MQAIQGNKQMAVKLYVACAEALNKIKVETSDDPNFQQAVQ